MKLKFKLLYGSTDIKDGDLFLSETNKISHHTALDSPSKLPLILILIPIEEANDLNSDDFYLTEYLNIQSGNYDKTIKSRIVGLYPNKSPNLPPNKIIPLALINELINKSVDINNMPNLLVSIDENGYVNWSSSKLEYEPEVIKVMTYSIKVEVLSDGSCNIQRTNDGFNAAELLGHLSFTQMDIIKQMGGEIKPNKVSRKFITD